jgi:membrane protein YdbS with pleckstrin-like domain
MILELHFKIAGTLLLFLAAAHLLFPLRFDWKRDLAQLTLLNRQMFYVHCFFIVLILAMFGGLTLFYSHLLLQPGELNRLVLAGFLIFWLVRLFVQLFVYDSRLWRGHRFNTWMHGLFTAFWAYLIVVYGCAFFS